MRDMEILKALLADGLVTLEEARLAGERQREIAEQGSRVRIDEVLVREGILKPEQLREYVFCVRCRRRCRVETWAPNLRVICAGCKSAVSGRSK